MERGEGTDGRGRPEGWVFVHPDAVPDRWRGRAVPMAAVPLVPGELAGLLGDGAVPELEPHDERILRLVARGLSARAMARELGVTPRSIQYRLARLRERFEVGSTAELVAEAARRGF